MTSPLALPRRTAALAIGVAALCLVVAIPVARASDGIDAPPDFTITITSALSDRTITVDAGDVIEFVNRDGERHRMRSRSEPEGFDTGNLEPGESYRFVLAVGGDYAYIDERHDEQTVYHGRIVVRAPATGGPDTDAVTVRMGDELFSPSSVTVAVGGRVTFENVDGDDHTATSTDGGPLASPVLTTGESYTTTLPEPGTFAYLCVIHPEMTGTIEVVGDAPIAPPEPAAPVSPSADPPTTAPGAEAPDAPIEIQMQDFAFDAPDVEVPTGSSVIWTNVGAAPHTATADDDSFDTTLVAAGGQASHTFTAAGTYDYLCIFHPGMIGTIRVVGAALVPGSASERAAQAPIASPPAETAPPAVPLQPAPIADGTRAGAVEASTAPIDAGASAATDPARSSSTGIDSLARLAVVIAIVTIAGSLFARAIQGTVRSAD